MERGTLNLTTPLSVNYLRFEIPASCNGTIFEAGTITEGVADVVVVDDEICWLGVCLYVGGFAGAWWAADEGYGWALSPGFEAGFVAPTDVACLAGCLEVVEVEPCAAVFDGDNVINLVGHLFAVWAFDFANPFVSVEDGASDALPRSGVLGFRHVCSVRVAWAGTVGLCGAL